MAWEQDLFAVLDDLEGQAEGAYLRERVPELADRSRAEYREVALAARLMASLGEEVALGVRGPGRLTGRLERVGADWCLLVGAAQDWVVPLAAVQTVGGASDRAVPEVAWSPLTRLGLASALRRLAEAAEPCVVHLRDGDRHDGVLARVGADFVELLEGGETRTRTVLVALTAIAAVSSRPA